MPVFYRGQVEFDGIHESLITYNALKIYADMSVRVACNCLDKMVENHFPDAFVVAFVG